MDIAATKRRIQRLIKVAEESYKKISELLDRMDRLQEDLRHTSEQVDHMEYELAEQRALLEAIAESQGVDVETLLAEADLPPEPGSEADGEGGAGDEQESDGEGSTTTESETQESDEGASKQATS
jgi:hypothetical protein